MRYYIKAFRDYCRYDGRAGRKELWLFFLFHCIAVFCLSCCDGFFGLYVPGLPEGYGALTLLYLAVSFCPAACVQIRRLHDVNKSGKWWIGFHLPIVTFYVLYLYLKGGEPTVNPYGPPLHGGQRHAAYGDSSLTAAQGIRYCRRCGFALFPESAFCSRCGVKVGEDG